MVLEDFPETLGYMINVAEQRQRRVAHHIDPSNCKMFEEDKVDAEDFKTELFGADRENNLTFGEQVTSRAKSKRNKFRKPTNERRSVSFLQDNTNSMVNKAKRKVFPAKEV